LSRRLGIALGALVLVAGVAVLWLHHLVTTLEVEPVTPSVSLVQASGLDGNVAILATPEGAVVVDTMTFRQQGARIRELAERLAGAPVRAVVNTHYHLDHSHGNPGFPGGTQIVASHRTREYMLAFDAGYWAGGNAETLPNDLVETRHELRVGDKTVRLLHLGRGHTGGDLVVHFVEDRVVALGDLLFHGRYPNVDLEAGGSIAEWDATLERVLALDFDRVIPGHGPLTGRDGIARFQAFLREVWELAQQAAREQLPLEETLELARRTLASDAGFVELGIPGLLRLDRDFVVRRAWEEATGAVRPAALPPSGSGG